MKKYTTLIIIAAAMLLVSGTFVMAEDAPVGDVGDEGTHQYLPTEPIAEDGEIAPEGVENSAYTTYGYATYHGTEGVSIGQFAGYNDDLGGNYNTNVGARAGYYNRYGDYNVYMGYWAGYSASGYGSNNVAIGHKARYTYSGSLNTSIGNYSGYNSNYSYNAQVGAFSGYNAGSSNAQLGYYSGYATGSGNTQLGYLSGYSANGTDYSVMLGYNSGRDADAADYSVFIGYRAGYYMDRANTLMIENSSSNTPLIYGEFDTNLVRVNGKSETVWSGANTVGDGMTTVSLLKANNTDTSLSSDAGFVLRNERAAKQWNFRTTRGGKGFAATINGTGGLEFEVVNNTNDFQDAQLYIGGVLVFANGEIQKAAIQP